MNIKQEIKKLQSDIETIENKTNGLFKKLLHILNHELFLYIKVFSCFFFFIGLVVSILVQEFRDAAFTLLIFATICGSHFLNILFHKTFARKKLSQKEQNIINDTHFSFSFDIVDEKLTFDYILPLFFSLRDIPKEKIITKYHNELIDFLKQDFSDKEKESILKYLNNVLTDCLIDRKISQDDFNNKLYQYVKTINYENKKTLLNLLDEKNKRIKDSDFCDLDSLLNQNDNSQLKIDNKNKISF